MSVPQANLSSNLSARRDSSLALSVRHQGSECQLAPIALFVYNRPQHTRQTIESLRANDLAQQSNLFVFADGAKDESGVAAVGAVRKLIRAIDGFKSVTLIEHERNLGLAGSVISGVTQLVDKFGRVIVVEDDLLTASDFLTFMNCALERYRDVQRVFSVNGFNFSIAPPAFYPWDAYFSYRSNSWGWGTWSDRWENVDWSVSDFPEFVADREQQDRFNRGGSDLTEALARCVANKLTGSWDLIWAYTHFRHDALALRPVDSKVYNIGFDGSGTHCRWVSSSQRALSSHNNGSYRFPDAAEPDSYFAAEIRGLHRGSLTRKFALYLFDKLGLR